MKYILIILIFSSPLFAEKIWVNKKERFDYEDIKDIECIDSLNCFAFTSSYNLIRIYNSTNQGDTWSVWFETSASSKEDSLHTIRTGYIFNKDQFYMLDLWRASVIKSTDGGKTFERKFYGDFSKIPGDRFGEIVMYDNNYGAGVTNHKLIITYDNWGTIDSIEYEGNLYSGEPIFFIDSTNIAILKEENYGHEFIKYDVEIKEWSQYSTSKLPPEEGDPKRINDIQFVNDSVAFGCGFQRVNKEGDYARDLIWKTTDSGASWDLIYSEYQDKTNGTQRISFLNEKKGMAVGSWGKIIMTEDGGDSWEHLEVPDGLLYATGQRVTWAGQYPLVSSFGYGIFRYEEVDLSSKDEFILDETQIKIRQTNTKLLISIEDDLHRLYDISIYDLHGNKIIIESIRSGIGTVFHPLRLNDFTNGFYFYNISTDGQSIKTGKFSVVN